MSHRPKKKVAIIGAGAAVMSCASTLANHPDQFEVTVIDIEPHTGGQATSIPLDESRYGASWLNDGVQGGSAIFRHTFQFFRRYGYEPQPVKLQVSFGKGPDNFWTNVFPSTLVDQLSGEIKMLGKVKVILRIFRFSDDFSNKMVLPLLALFLGTSNQTPNVSSVLLERLFDRPRMKLWEYDPDTLLPNLPTMFTFPKLGDFDRDWAVDLRSKGVDIRLNCTTSILERGKKGVILQPQLRDNNNQPKGEPITESFDEMVLCCPADESKKPLDHHATWRENYVLGWVKFFNDLTITHSDAKYFQKIFEAQYKPDLFAQPTSQERKNQISFAEQQPHSEKDVWKAFRPMYYTHSFASDPDKIEMGFDCTSYQHQFREHLGMNQPTPPLDRHVFQTIFLNDQQQHLWTWNDIDSSKIIARKPWHQFSHRWQHYLRVVPGMMWINGKHRTLYAGSWTMVNMHEIACVSGIAAAYQLGAAYEPFNDFAKDFFFKYLLVCHGTCYKRKAKTT